MKQSCTFLFVLLLACIPNLANAQTADFFRTIGRSMEINANTPKHHVENFLKSVIPFDTLICYSKIMSISKYSPNDTGLIDELRVPFPQKLFNLSISSQGTGKQIFSSDKSNVRWNGKFNNSGEDVPEGKYIVTIVYSYRGTDKINCVLVELDLKRPQLNPNALISAENSSDLVDKYVSYGLSISPSVGLWGIQMYKFFTNPFLEGVMMNFFYNSSWLGYEVGYGDFQYMYVGKSGLYVGLGFAGGWVRAVNSEIENSHYGIAWSCGYNLDLGKLYLGVGSHFYNISSARLALTVGFRIIDSDK